MDQFLDDEQVPVRYSPKVREYSLPLNNKRGVSQGFDYCPWCGTKLPDSLRQEYFSILREEYSVEDPLDPRDKHKIPKEFENDEWWKKRGL